MLFTVISQAKMQERFVGESYYEAHHPALDLLCMCAAQR